MTNNFKVVLLNHSGLGVAELGSRCCYDSFDKSEHSIIKDMPIVLENPDSDSFPSSMKKLHDIPHSTLLDSLSWVHQHFSILEHITLQYHLTTSRGVLQELSRHRVGVSPSVRSTRYTGKTVIDAYIASKGDVEWFIDKVREFNMFAYEDSDLEYLEIQTIFYKLNIHGNIYELLSKKAKEVFDQYESDSSEDLYKLLSECKAKRNALDPVKFIVTDMWLTDIVWTINLRALKNFLDLRNSGAAWFPIQKLSQLIEETTPNKYLRLISKKYK